MRLSFDKNLLFPISVPQWSLRRVNGQFESHWIKMQRIRMLILAWAPRELSNHPAYFTRRETETQREQVIFLRLQTGVGQACWRCSAQFFFKVTFL